MPTIRQKSGFSLLEAILSVALFSLMVLGITSAILVGEQSTALSGARMRASLLAEEGLEAARNIRDENFTNLVDGTYGLNIVNNQWAFSGAQDVTDGFTRQITISTVDSNTKNIVSSVNWQQNAERTGNVTLTTHLTNWKIVTQQAYNLGLNFNNVVMGANNTSKICNLVLSNNGPFDVTIDKMRLDWTPNQTMKAINFNGVQVWGQTQSSVQTGTVVDITDVIIHAGQSVGIDSIDFNGQMLNTDYFTVTFIMGDGSVTSPKFIVTNADKNAC